VRLMLVCLPVIAQGSCRARHRSRAFTTGYSENRWYPTAQFSLLRSGF